jgi:hypothetical protein
MIEVSSISKMCHLCAPKGSRVEDSKSRGLALGWWPVEGGESGWLLALELGWDAQLLWCCSQLLWLLWAELLDRLLWPKLEAGLDRPWCTT